MEGRKPIYVIDTNVVIDYVDIIPTLNGPTRILENPTVDLSEAHIVIPSVVIRELSNFKRESSERGRVAREALRRIREIIETTSKTMEDAYHLKLSVEIGEQTLTILPVHKDFTKGLSFHPSDSDMDGQIILAALSIEYIEAGHRVDGSKTYTEIIHEEGLLSPGCVVDDIVVNYCESKKRFGTNAILLTNDNGLAIRARERGVMTSRYGYKYSDPYTGRRDIVVPRETYAYFIEHQILERADFEAALPDEPKLVANEFIIMNVKRKRDYPEGYDPKDDSDFKYIGRYDKKKDAIVRLRHIKNFPVEPKNPGQAIYAEALQTDNFAAVICTGPAGSGKTYMATVYGYNACQDGRFIGVTVVPCESRSKTGALPGTLEEKMDPDVQPLKNALRNYLLFNDESFAVEMKNIRKFASRAEGNGIKSESGSIKISLQEHVDIIWDDFFSSVPIESARGRDFAYELALYDEFQDQTVKQADTLIKRLGCEGKIVITGDVWQVHSPYLDIHNNGLVYASELLYDNPMVAQVCFKEDEVIRHPLVQMIAKKQEAATNRRLPSQQN